MALGFFAAWNVVGWLCKKTGRDANALSNLLISLMVAGVVGARIAYVVEHWESEFAAHPFDVIRVDQGGLMFYGGLILALVVFFGWCVFKKEKVLELADLLATVIPLGHAFGRIGCFFYGCCYGRLSDSAVAVAFPRQSPAWYEQMHAGLIPASAQSALPVLPTQLFESAAVFALFLILFAVYWRTYVARGDGRPPRSGIPTGCYFIGYALERFAMEFLRGDPRAAVGPLSISQTISLAMLLLGGAFLYRGFRSVARS